MHFHSFFSSRFILYKTDKTGKTFKKKFERKSTKVYLLFSINLSSLLDSIVGLPNLAKKMQKIWKIWVWRVKNCVNCMTSEYSVFHKNGTKSTAHIRDTDRQSPLIPSAISFCSFSSLNQLFFGSVPEVIILDNKFSSNLSFNNKRINK